MPEHLGVPSLALISHSGLGPLKLSLKANNRLPEHVFVALRIR